MSHPHLRKAHMYFATNKDERELAVNLGGLPLPTYFGKF